MSDQLPDDLPLLANPLRLGQRPIDHPCETEGARPYARQFPIGDVIPFRGWYSIVQDNDPGTLFYLGL